MQGPYMICACGYAYPKNINKLKYVGAGVIFPNLDVLESEICFVTAIS